MKKRIVICCDGTWNRPDQKDRGEPRPSNVSLLALSIPAVGSDGIAQHVYYHVGVGTRVFDRFRGGIFGRGLANNLRHAYAYLADVYVPGDEIFLFGFSRGAYTARSLGGLVRNCGILRKEHRYRVREAYKLYRRRDPESKPRALEATLFRASFSHEVRIKCIGVWDTVGSLGIPIGIFRWSKWMFRELFHDVKLSKQVDNAFQALAIDERRRPFRPSIWERASEADKQRLEQRWFVGAHSNVGGGYEDTGLSSITLKWMMDCAISCGLTVDERRLEAFGQDADANPLGELRNSMNPLYWVCIPIRRRIGVGIDSTNEMVYPGVYERRRQDSSYRPPNLPAKP